MCWRAIFEVKEKPGIVLLQFGTLYISLYRSSDKDSALDAQSLYPGSDNGIYNSRSGGRSAARHRCGFSLWLIWLHRVYSVVHQGWFLSVSSWWIWRSILRLILFEVELGGFSGLYADLWLSSYVLSVFSECDRGMILIWSVIWGVSTTCHPEGIRVYLINI